MMPSDEARELWVAAELGMDAATFMRSKLGKYILRRANEEYQDALAELADVDPTNPERIRALQSDIKRCVALEAWLREAVEAGRNAEGILEQGRGEDD